MAAKKNSPQDPLEAAKVGAPGEPPDEEGTPDEAIAAAAAAGVSLPGLPKPPVPPPAVHRKFRVLKDKQFSLRGQIVNWKAGRVIDESGYGGEVGIQHLLASGIELQLVE